MTRSVFYGVSAYVGALTGETTIQFWPDDPSKFGWALNKAVSVDLARNPEAVRQGIIKPDPKTGIVDVDVDDFAGYGTGGLTRVGPRFPGGATVGLVYLEDSKCAALDAAYDPRKPAAGTGNAYEWVTVVDYDGGRRFHGFHGVVQKVSTNPQLALVSLWARGTGHMKGHAPMGTYWIDFGTFVLSGDPTLVSIDPKSGATGGIYIDHKAGGGGVTTFDTPKNPKAVGGVRAPRSSHAL